MQVLWITAEQAAPSLSARLWYGTVTGPSASAVPEPVGYALVNVEPMTGIEPAYSAWEAFLRSNG